MLLPAEPEQIGECVSGLGQVTRAPAQRAQPGSHATTNQQDIIGAGRGLS
jgi:hypothetical protein